MSVKTLQYLPFYIHWLTALFFISFYIIFQVKKVHKKNSKCNDYVNAVSFYGNVRFGRKAYQNRKKPGERQEMLPCRAVNWA